MIKLLSFFIFLFIQVGLWLGLSVITVFEFIELIYDICTICLVFGANRHNRRNLARQAARGNTTWHTGSTVRIQPHENGVNGSGILTPVNNVDRTWISKTKIDLRAIPFEILRTPPPHILFFSRTPPIHFIFFADPPVVFFCNSTPRHILFTSPQEHFYTCISKGKN